MFYRKINRQYLSNLVIFIVLQANLASGQICQNAIPDFFYNVNFAGPFFDQAVYTASSLSVLSPNGTMVFTFDVRASFVPTTATPGIITVRANDPDFAVVSLSNGSYAVVTNTFPLDYFSPYNRYLFDLIATQSHSNRPDTSSTATVQINLENDNVHAPIFVPDNQTFSISETAAVGTLFGTVYATDADNDGVIYSINSSLFSIDPATGVLQLQQIFQPSSAAQYFVTVTVSDDGSSCSLNRPLCPRYQTSATMTINVIAVNKNSPTFLNAICGSTVSFFEGNSIGANITTITTFDDDRRENGQMTISFPSEQSSTAGYSQFYLEQTPQVNATRTAFLRTNMTFDYDAPGASRVWYLLILVVDNGTTKRQSLCNLRVNLLDLNDNSPIFAMTSWNCTIYRTAFDNATNPRFLRILASDADSGSNGMINYFIGTVNLPYLTINQTTGMIILRPGVSIANLQVSQFPITFQVYARDQGTPPRMSTTNATVTIYYDDGNGLPAGRWLDSRYEELNFPIIEKYYETYRHRPIFNDSFGFNGTIFYTLTPPTSSILTVSSPFLDAIFPFSNLPVSTVGDVFSSGIAVTSALHAEIENIYLIEILVLVQPPLIATATINIIDQNDQIPTFDIRSLTLNIVENESGTRAIGQIRAFDRDVDFPNNFVQYRLNENLSDVEVLGNFFVDSNGTVFTNATFDRESNKTLYRLFLTAFDGAPAWDSTTGEPNTEDFQLDVQVTDVNDSPAVFVNSSTITISIDETISNGTGILNLTVIDRDFDTLLDFGILTGNLKNVFAFSLLYDNLPDPTRMEYQAVAQLYVVGPLSYESTPNYTLVLFAFDTLNLAQITVNIDLLPQNTKAPIFNFMPGFTAYVYQVTEGTAVFPINGPMIRATDPDSSSTALVYEIVTNNNQFNFESLFLNETTLGIVSPGLSRDLPFGAPVYNFSIQVTDQGVAGVSSYVPVMIQVIDINNNAPIPTNSPWILTEGVVNPSTTLVFTDYDDPAQNNTLPFQVRIIPPTNFSLSGPTLNFNGSYTLTYNGIFNRTVTKNLTVTFNTSDNKGFSAITTIPIIVADVLNASPISDGFKTITVLYVDGYANSLRNVPLGSVYVQDSDDWYRASRTYAVQNMSNGQAFSAAGGLLSTPDLLSPGNYTVRVAVTKPIASSAALSTASIGVTSVDSESVRQAATIRIEGEYPETLIDPSLGNRLNTLRNALASFLLVTTDSIQILAIRPVYQYRSPYYPPLPFDQAKQQALTDVVFYVPSLSRNDIENTISNNLTQFSARFGIVVNASGPNPCSNYVCPVGTICRPTRTIQPLPSAIDSNQTSFVGVNILDSADCVNPGTSVPDLGPSVQVLGRSFNENGAGGYAVFDGASFSTRAPTRFSLEFAVRSPITDGLILLYGRNTAIEIYQSKLRFHFQDLILDASSTPLNASTWYHVEYQHIASTILLSINNCQYVLSVNDTLSTENFSSVRLYLGGLPANDSSLTQANTFSGCVRNVLSNGRYLDMNSALTTANSQAGHCPCTFFNSCISPTLSTTTARAAELTVNILFIWIMMALLLTNE